LLFFIKYLLSILLILLWRNTMGLGIFLIFPLILIGGPALVQFLNWVFPPKNDYSKHPRHQQKLPQDTYGN
jgi:hypothetical protein